MAVMLSSVTDGTDCSPLTEKTRGGKVFSFDEIHGVHGDQYELALLLHPYHPGLKMDF